MHGTADRIIFVALGALVGLTLIAFFVNPAYEKAVDAGFAAIGLTLSGACGFKFGVTNGAQEPPAGSSTVTSTVRETNTPAGPVS